MTITEFLEARIAEDEALARAAIQGEWVAEDAGGVHQIAVCIDNGELQFFAEWSNDPKEDWASTTQHIARHDPARVLAECAAKRAIIEQFPALRSERGKSQNAIIEALAAVYKDHPDYRREWE